MKVQGKFKLQAHPLSGVVMDVAAFKVSHSDDIDAAALRAARAMSSSIGPWNVTCMGSIRRKTHGALPRCTDNSEHTIGAMDECLGKGRRRAHISRGIRIHIGVGQRCRARDVESPTLPAKRTSAFRFKGAMEESSGRV